MKRLVIYYGLVACCAAAAVVAAGGDLSALIPARVADSSVRAAGRLTAEGQPLGNLRPFFHTAGMRAAAATTRADGSFEAGLDSPGDYMAIVGATDLPPTTSDVAINANHTLTTADAVQCTVLGPTAPTGADTAASFGRRTPCRPRIVNGRASLRE